MRQAAIEADRDGLEDAVDFPSVRESLKSQMSVALAAKMEHDPEMRSNPFAGLGAMLIPTMVDRAVDTMMTPDGIAAIIKRGKVERQGAEPAKTDGPEFVQGYRDLNRFAVNPKGPDGKTQDGAMIFERRGLFSWKLVRFELPQNFMDGR